MIFLCKSPHFVSFSLFLFDNPSFLFSFPLWTWVLFMPEWPTSLCSKRWEPWGACVLCEPCLVWRIWKCVSGGRDTFLAPDEPCRSPRRNARLAGGRRARAPIINRMNECMPRLLLQLILLLFLLTFQGVTNQLHCISPWCWWHSGLQNHENFEGP